MGPAADLGAAALPTQAQAGLEHQVRALQAEVL